MLVDVYCDVDDCANNVNGECRCVTFRVVKSHKCSGFESIEGAD